MAKGTSKLSLNYIKESANSFNGSQIDLKGMPLTYISKELGVNQKERQALEKIEQRIVKSDVENGAVVDENGNILWQGTSSNNGHVEIPYIQGISTVTHNHPRANNDGLLGGTFSNGDLRMLVQTDIKSIRATTSEGTYSISKGKNFDSAGFMAYIGQSELKRRREYNNTERRLKDLVGNGKLTAKDYYDRHNKAFNKYLVDKHNDLINGGTKYGYSYGLEKNGGKT